MEKGSVEIKFAVEEAAEYYRWNFRVFLITLCEKSVSWGENVTCKQGLFIKRIN